MNRPEIPQYPEDILQGDVLLERAAHFRRFGSLPRAIASQELVSPLIDDIRREVSRLPKIDVPKTRYELLQAELGRRLGLDLSLLEERYLSTRLPTWEKTVELYSIPLADLERLEPWLEENLPLIIEANNRFYSDFSARGSRHDVPLGIEAWKRRAVDVLQGYIGATSDVLDPVLDEFAGWRAFRRHYTVAPNTNDGSNIDNVTRYVSLDVRRLVYIENGKILVDPTDFLSHWGEECFGHGRHLAISQDLVGQPQFLREASGLGVDSSIESIGQYFAKRLFDVFDAKPELYGQIGFSGQWEQVSRNFRDQLILANYWKKLRQTAIYLFASLGPGSEGKVVEKLSKYSLRKGWIDRTVESFDVDSKTKAIHPKEVARLRYADETVDRILNFVPSSLKKRAEDLIVAGYWTPTGLRQMVELELGIKTSG